MELLFIRSYIVLYTHFYIMTIKRILIRDIFFRIAVILVLSVVVVSR